MVYETFLLLVPFFVLGSPLEAQDVGRLLFKKNCIACHGRTGRGDGPASKGLATQPADLTKIAERRDGVWPILEIISILDGYFENTNQREGMPIFENLLDKAQLALIMRAVRSVGFLRRRRVSRGEFGVLE